MELVFFEYHGCVAQVCVLCFVVWGFCLLFALCSLCCRFFLFFFCFYELVDALDVSTNRLLLAFASFFTLHLYDRPMMPCKKKTRTPKEH